MRNVTRGLIVMALVAAGTASSFARADDPVQKPSPPATGQQQATPPEGEKTQNASEAKGIVQMVDEALQGIELRHDQSDTIQKLGADVDAKVGTVDAAKRDLLVSIADEVEAGKVDPSTLKQKEHRFADAAADASPVVRSALEKLHDTLDPAQRKQFVSNFRDAMKKNGGMMSRKATLDELSSTLNLTDDQKQKVSDILGQDSTAADVARARIELVLAAFPGERFKIDELLAPASSVRERAQELADRIVEVAARVTDVLTADQRKNAAQRIRDKVSGKSGVSQTSASLETTDTAAEPIWVGGARAGVVGGRAGYVGGYRSFSGYGYAGGYTGGWGGAYLI